MSPRPRTTTNKRQKEQARQEKRRAKEQRTLQRKLDRQSGTPAADLEEEIPNEHSVTASPSPTETELPPSWQS